MADKIHVRTNINDSDVDFLCESRQSLMEVLRDVLGLTGTKEGCNDGNCGACTIILDGVIVDSCCVEVSTRSASTLLRGGVSPSGQHANVQATCAAT